MRWVEAIGMVIGMAVCIKALEWSLRDYLASACRWLGLRRDPQHRLYEAVRLAGHQIDDAHHGARCRMNEAAGQSWRNLAE